MPLPVFCHRLPIYMSALGFAYVRLTPYLEHLFEWAFRFADTTQHQHPHPVDGITCCATLRLNN
jgi:hypothetical protein